MEWLINEERNKIQFIITRPTRLDNIEITFNKFSLTRVSSFVILRKDFEGLSMKDRIVFSLFHNEKHTPVFNNYSTYYPKGIFINKVVISKAHREILEENLICGIVLSSRTTLENLNINILGSF